MKASLGRVSSLSDDIPNIIVDPELPMCQRMGIMAAFNSFDQFKVNFRPIIDMFTSPPNTPDITASYATKYQKVRDVTSCDVKKSSHVASPKVVQAAASPLEDT